MICLGKEKMYKRKKHQVSYKNSYLMRTKTKLNNILQPKIIKTQMKSTILKFSLKLPKCTKRI